MSETVANVPCFEQSVSFGRFEHDSLCWERWSTFPTNKYLEEVEKCSTPGSVAQKKAYFEAHYKNVAARRAELLLDLERGTEAELVNLDNSASRILVYGSSEKDNIDDEKADTEISAREVDQLENQMGSFDGEAIVEHVTELSGTIDSAGVFSQDNEVLDLYNDMSGHTDGPASEKETEKAGIERPINVINQWENRVSNFDGEVIGEYVSVKNDSADDFNEENEVSSNNDEEVSVEHVHMENDTDVIISEENEVANICCDMSGHIDCAHTDLTSDKGEGDFVDFKDGDTIILEVSEVVRTEVAKNIAELNDDSVIVDEVVKREMVVHSDEPNDKARIIEESGKQDQEEIAGESSCPTLKVPVIVQLKEPVSTTEDTPSVSEGLPEEKVKRIISEDKIKSLVKLTGPKKVQQATSVKKNTSTMNAKNKPASPVSKRTSVPMPQSSMLSTSKPSKPDLTKVPKLSNRLLDKKEKGVTPLSSKKTVGPQSKRLAPTYLHKSLNLGPTNSDPVSLTRRSLIMESMSDKDIVKRAFKAFQKPPQMSPPSLNKSPATNQTASRKAEPKGSAANTLPKKTERIERVAKTAGTCTGQQGTRKTLPSPGVKNNGVADQRNVKSAAASRGPRVQLQGNNQKPVSKKLELKPRSNVLEATHIQSKLKVEKAAHVKNLSQSINSKPKLPSSSNRVFGGAVHKENATSKLQASG